MTHDDVTPPAAQAAAHGIGWREAFALAMSVSGGLYVFFGTTMAAVGAAAALGIWAISAAIGWLQNNLFAEMASMFPDKPGGVPIYAHEAWRSRCAPAGALATFGYWFGWSAVISITTVTAGGLIEARWFADSTFRLGPAGPAQLVGIALMLALLIPNLRGAQPAAWVNKVVGVLLLGTFAVFIVAPLVSGSWDAGNLTSSLGQPGADSWGGVRNVLAWLYLVGWTAYGTEMCAAFMPEYRTRSDSTKALFSSGAYTTTMFALVPLGIGGLVSQQEAQADPSAVFLTGFARVVPTGALGDLMVIAIIGALLMCVNAAMADGSRALAGAAMDGLTPTQFGLTNRHGVPHVALFTAVLLNIALIVAVSNPVSILVAANLGYLTAIVLALAGFLLLRRDLPDAPRPFRVGAHAVPMAVALTAYNVVVLVVGAASADLTGYGGPREFAIGVSVLLVSLVFFVIRRRGQERRPLWRDPHPAAPAAVPTPVQPV